MVLNTLDGLETPASDATSDGLVDGFQVRELRSLAPVSRGGGEDLLASRTWARMMTELARQDPAAPRQPRRSRKAIHSVRWLEPEEFFIQPRSRRTSSLALKKPEVLLLRASWAGSPRGVQLTVVPPSGEQVKGRVTRVPPDRGTVLLTARVDRAGELQLTIRNPDAAHGVSVQLVIGRVPFNKD